MKGIIAKKIGMTRIYDEQDRMVPVTVVEAGPCTVIQVKDRDRHGYNSVQLGFGSRKSKNVSKAVRGHCAPAGLGDNPPVAIREFRAVGEHGLSVGDMVKAESFEENDFVDVVGRTKGRGFQGCVKRYNFAGGRFSHGGGWKRKPGSVGQCEFPGRVDKGKKMPGQMGNVRRTVQNLKVLKVVPEDNILMLKGAVPGPNGGFLLIKSAVKKSS